MNTLIINQMMSGVQNLMASSKSFSLLFRGRLS